MLTRPQAALLFKALSDETRLKIVEMLSCGELCACNILEAFEITQPTLSYHMKILTDCGLVQARKDGAWMRYTLQNSVSNDLGKFLVNMTAGKTDCICRS